VRSAEQRAAASRVGAIRALGLGAFLILSARAAHLTVIDDQGHDLWGRQVYARFELAPARGAVYDRRGTELAVSITAPSVYAIAGELDDAAHAALARALGTPKATLTERLAGRTGFTYVARWVGEKEAHRVAELGLPGVGLVAEPKRAYPAGALAGGLLGFTNIDGKGVRGIEQAENAWLSGTRLVVPVERDGGGQLLARAPLRPSDAAGGDVALTLDASLQASAETALAEAVERTGARGGTIITLDPATGDVLALAQAPGFDPNGFRATPYRNTGSAAFDAASEPGSTLKVFLAAAALERGAVGRDEPIDTGGGQIQVPGKTIRDRRNFGTLDLGGMLRVSSNVAAVIVGQRVGRGHHPATLRRVGFGERTGSGFPGESSGLLRPWRDWKPIEHATIAYGQGVSATPIQLAAATAALANGGEWRPPRLVLARRPPEGDWQYARPSRARRVVSRETAAAVLEMMGGVVSSHGTGRLAGLATVSVAGKTGTAQKLDPKTRRYGDDYIAWFIGAVPAEAPRLVVTVALDEPRQPHTGGAAAAPLFARVASAQLAHLGIITQPEPLPLGADPTPTMLADTNDPMPTPPERTPEAPAAPPEPIPSQPPLEVARIGDRIFVPDFRGYTLPEVRQITAAHALDLQASGSGRAISQRPAPGTVLAGRERRVHVRFGEGRAQARSERRGRQG
jgi:cell division protein FtsI (penicillin-binding protein 3)